MIFYAVLGHDEGGQILASTEVFFNGAWQQGPPLYAPLVYAGGALIHPHQLLIVGGGTDNGALATVQSWVFEWDGTVENLRHAMLVSFSQP